MFNENRLVFLRRGELRSGTEKVKFTVKEGAEAKEKESRKLAVDFMKTLVKINGTEQFLDQLTNPKRQENVLIAWLGLSEAKGGKELKGAKAAKVAAEMRKWINKEANKKKLRAALRKLEG